MTMQEPDVRVISRDDLLKKMRNGDRFILVDVLTHDHFIHMHLPGSINLPVNMLRDLAPLVLGKTDQIIVYCANFNCTASPTAAKLLMQMGYTDVLDYAGGILDWEEAGLPVMKEEPPRAQAA